MRITLQTLVGLGVCEYACEAFIETFGEGGIPTALDVFHAIAARDKHLVWFYWLCHSLDGFIEAVSVADKVSFEIISKRQPLTIQVIKDNLTRGQTGREMEQELIERFGRKCPIAALVTGAAYYLEAKRETVQTKAH